MIPRLLNAWNDVRSSLWAVPFLMVLGSVGLAFFGIRTKIGQGSDPVWFLYSGDAAAAPQFLSNLLTSMITMATLAISITMVVLTLAAQQLGPRLIRSFMGDRRTQLALGLFIATVVYLLLVLRATSGATDSIPNLAVTVGTGLVLLSITTLLLFVHHLANSIVADHAVIRVGEAFDANAARLLPERDEASGAPAVCPLDRGKSAAVLLTRGGYVQAIDHGEIVAAALKAGTRVELALRAGHHAIPGTPAAWIEDRQDNEALEETLLNSILIGNELTETQDPEYSLRQLVEIAQRALSSGISDPYTAIAVVDRLALSLAKIMKRGPAPGVWCDADGVPRVWGPSSTFAGLVDTAFEQIRQQATSVPAVLIRIVDNLGQLVAIANDEQRPVLVRHLDLATSAGRAGIQQAYDRRSLKERAEAARQSCG